MRPAPMRMKSTSSSGRGFPASKLETGFHFVGILLKHVSPYQGILRRHHEKSPEHAIYSSFMDGCDVGNGIVQIGAGKEVLKLAK